MIVIFIYVWGWGGLAGGGERGTCGERLRSSFIVWEEVQGRLGGVEGGRGDLREKGKERGSGSLRGRFFL